MKPGNCNALASHKQAEWGGRQAQLRRNIGSRAVQNLARAVERRADSGRRRPPRRVGVGARRRSVKNRVSLGRAGADDWRGFVLNKPCRVNTWRVDEGWA